MTTEPARRYDPTTDDGRRWVARWRDEACSAWPDWWQRADVESATELVDWIDSNHPTCGGYWTAGHSYFRVVDLDGDKALADFSPGYLWVFTTDYSGGVPDEATGRYRFVELSRFVARRGGVQREESYTVCPVCFITLPASGVCDDHGAPDA